MRIDQVGHSVIHTTSRDLSLNNVLYVLESSKTLVSIHLLEITMYSLNFIPSIFLLRIGP
jgi:hypothetical protein